MVDIHCHILPFVDDGAETMEDALEMARMAAASGVTHIIATPHCNLPYEQEKNYRSSALMDRFSAFQELVRAADIPLSVSPGAEVFCTPEVPGLLRRDRLLTLAGSSYLLVEFFFDEELSFIDDMLRAIQAQGLTPVIAHPERYEAVQRTPYVIERWFQSGCIIQVNKGSFLGRLGRRAGGAADWILSRGLAHAVASDAHSPTVRTTQMTQLSEYLTQLCAPEYAGILLRDNPARILSGLPVLGAG